MGIGGTAIYSDDGGVNWLTATTGTTNDLRGIDSGGNKVAAVGAGGTVRFPFVDTINTWYDWVSNTTNTLYGIVYDGSNWVAVGQSGSVIYSIGGSSFVAGTSPTTESTILLSVNYDGVGRFIATSYTGAIIYSDDTGANWTAATSGTINALEGVVFED